MFFNQSFAGASFAGQDVVVNVIAHFVVEQEQRICRRQHHRWLGILQDAFQFEIGVLGLHGPQGRGRRRPHVRLFVVKSVYCGFFCFCISWQ